LADHIRRQIAISRAIGLEISVLGEQFGHLGFDRLRQQRARPVAQNFGERIGERSWLGEQFVLALALISASRLSPLARQAR
jgi:hypothetical protein